MRAVIYCRVSTEEQTKNLSLPTQQKACADYCQRQGFEVDRIFVEQGESAKTVNRPQFKDLINYCRENKHRVQFLVVYNLSRFSRNTHDHLAVRALLAGYGISLRSVNEQIDESSTGRFLESVLAAVAQLDNDMRSDRTVAGMKAQLEAGHWTYPAPLGYLSQTDANGKPVLVHDADRVPLVRQAFELYATGVYTKEQVRKIINDAGLRTRTSQRLATQTLDQMLHNPLYAGWMVVDKWNIRKRGQFEPIVTEELFNNVQEVLSGRKPTITPMVKNRPEFPLRGLVRCGNCGLQLTASWSKGRTKRYPYYHCTHTGCTGTTVRKEDLEAKFVVLLERLQLQPDLAKILTLAVTDTWHQKEAEVLMRTSALTEQLNELQGRKDRLIEAFIYKQAIDEQTYHRQLDKLNQEITLTEIDLHEAKLDEFDIAIVLQFSEHILVNAARLWVELSLDQKQRLQKVLFPDGVVFKDGELGTAVTSGIFKVLEQAGGQKTNLAPRGGLEPPT